MNDNISDKDKKDWQTFISSKEKILDKDFKNQEKKLFRTKSIDLHGYTLDDANSKVREIILSCKENNYREILLITGKGLHSKNDKDIIKYANQTDTILVFSKTRHFRH